MKSRWKSKQLGWILVVLALLFLGCGESGEGAQDASDISDSSDGADLSDSSDLVLEQDLSDTQPPPADGLYLTSLNTWDEWASIATFESGPKYLAPIEGLERAQLVEDCYFQNMHRHEWHLTFLREAFLGFEEMTFDDYLAFVLRRSTRKWWGGTLHLWSNVLHPGSDKVGVVSYSLYTESGPEELPSLDELAEVDTTMKACAPVADEMLAWLPEGPEQIAWAVDHRSDLLDRDVTTILPTELLQGSEPQPMSLGEGYGYLKIVPQGLALGDYGLRDVIVVESAPNDIGVVAGLITRHPQNPHSHVNLRLVEKGIPNAVLPTVYESDFVASMPGQLVHYVVEEARVTLEPALLEDAEAFWELHRPSVPDPQADLSVEALKTFAQIGHGDALVYGAKAANLGELHEIVPEAHRLEGFAIPFAHYQRHLETHQIDLQIQQVLDDPRLEADAAWRSDALDDLRDAIRDAPLDPLLFEAIQAQAEGLYGEAALTTFLRFRSSTNVEDLDALTGAGLYDSRTGCLADDLDGDEIGPSKCLSEDAKAFLEARRDALIAEQGEHPERIWLAEMIEDIDQDLSEEKPAAKALRKVWRSVWSERAYEERAYYGIDHLDAYMGVAVNPSFVLEQVNAVVVTNLQVGGDPLYRVVSQVGYESVVRPDDPSAYAEVLTFRRAESGPEEWNLLSTSSLVPQDTSLWSETDRLLLAQVLFAVQDHYSAHIHPEAGDHLQLDLEVKITAEGKVVPKQVRPYLSAH